MKSRVLMIETSGFGGLAYYTYYLCDKLSVSPDIDLTLITHTDYELSHYQSNYKIIQKNLIGAPYLSTVMILFGVVKRECLDIIHVQSLLTARKDWLLFIIARLLRFSVLFTTHNVLPHDEEERTAFGMRFAYKMICKWSKAIITHSEYNRRALCSLFGLKETRISTIKNGNYLCQTNAIK